MKITYEDGSTMWLSTKGWWPGMALNDNIFVVVASHKLPPNKRIFIDNYYVEFCRGSVKNKKTYCFPMEGGGENENSHQQK